MMKTRLVAVLLGTLCATGFARIPEFQEHRAVQESLSRVPPKFRAEWLRARGLDDSYYTTYRRPESTGLRLVGKYGRGPSVAVTGRDTLVVLSLGSEVALVSFANPDQPRVLSEIQVNYLPGTSALLDSFILIAGNGIEVWDITDPTRPSFRHVIPYAVSGIAVFDTLLYFVSRDTFHAFSIARPASPYRTGFCLLTGNVGAATANTVVLRQPGDLLGFIDVTDPQHPQLAGTYPGYALAFAARNTICCAAMYWSTDEDHFRFEVLDISDPANVRRIAALDSIGGWDIHLSGPLAFVSGDQNPKWEFTILNLSDSAHPQVISSCRTPGDNYGVWADWTLDWAYVADRLGLAAMDISNLNSPRLDTIILKAHLAEDVWLDGARAYVADGAAGLRILDVANVAQPTDLGGIDSANVSSRAVVARDSFAFAGGWPGPDFRSICVSDPTHPVMAGGGAAETDPQDMVLRDTLIYLAGRFRFNVLNVARPRSPVLVGSCTLPGTPTNLWMTDTLAFASRYVVNTMDPAHPVLTGTLPAYTNAVAVWDSWVFAPALFDSMVVYAMTDPAAPRKVASLVLSGGHIWNSGAELADSLFYVGGDIVHVVNVADPLNPYEVAAWTPPRKVPRVLYAAPYLYASCWEAGVCILETVQTGVSEPAAPQGQAATVRVRPTVARRRVVVEAPAATRRIDLYDVAGVRVNREAALQTAAGLGRWELDLSGLPAGIYVVNAATTKGTYTTKLVITKGR